jgi:hypothetical protein
MLSYISKRCFSINFHRISNLDSDLTSLHETVKRFADEKVAPLAVKADKLDAFPN